MIECRERRERIRVQGEIPVYGCRIHVECAEASLPAVTGSCVKDCRTCTDLVGLRTLDPAPAAPAEEAIPCIHRGARIRQQHCPPCKGRTGRSVELPVFACGVHQECILEATGLRLKACNLCHDRTVQRPPDPPPLQTRQTPNVKGLVRDRSGQPADWWQDFYHGATAFLVCGGPSLNLVDLTQLNRRGLLVAAVNQCAATHVRPHVWFSVDSPSHFHQAIWRDPAIAKFVKIDKATLPTAERRNGRWVQSGPPACDVPNTWFFRHAGGFEPETFLSRPKVVWSGTFKMPNGKSRETKSVMLPALRLLFWMGVRTIVLIGCDFKMSPTSTYAFDDPKDAAASGYNNNTYAILNQWFRALHPIALSYGLRIFNATPGSRLDGFPPIEYDAALQMAAEGFPAVETVAGHYRA